MSSFPPAPQTIPLDVLCVGHAAYDLVFSVPHHPNPDEKIFADGFIACGGGPAANAAVTVARLGLKAAFGGRLGRDIYGEKHWDELTGEGVCTRFIARCQSPTPLSVVLVKPDGRRALVNYKGETLHTPVEGIDFSAAAPRVMLFDGHEPLLSVSLAARARTEGIVTILDAGSLHEGTQALMGRVDYLVASEKFAWQYLGRQDEDEALSCLAEHASIVVITLGERGLVWKRGDECGALPAFPVAAVDTTGAGDAFHGAFAAAVAAGMAWRDVLRYASAAGALCCTKMGARTGLPSLQDLQGLLQRHPDTPIDERG
jgi:sulfofructose kinase